jgi:hypothetical protein
MKRISRRWWDFARSFVDFALVLALIWALALTTVGSHGRTFLGLSLAIAGLGAFNLAFVRHLRRVYASPRRGVWRRV